MTFRGLTCPLKLRHFVSIFLFMLLQSVFPATARAASCDTVKISNHFTLIFQGVTYNYQDSTSKWDYALTWDGQPPALSYFFIELCSLLTDDNLLAVEPSSGSIGYNGNAKLYGIKWDNISRFPANTPVLFSFTLDQLLAVDHTTFAPKAGVNQNLATICGPSIFCDIFQNPCVSNTPPVAHCPGDTTIVVNEFAQICLGGFGTADLDGNLASILVTGGSFNNGAVCFIPVEGANVIRLIATDSCGAADTCVTVVTVRRNEPPVCQLPPDSSTILFCAGQETCLDISAFDPDGNLQGCSIISGPGQIVNDTRWCYTPAGNETVSVTIECVDSLGLTCSGTFTVEFVVSNPPVVGAVEVTDVFLCNSEQPVCVQLDINNYGNPFTVSSQLGQFNLEDSSICFAVDTTGHYCNRVIVTNNCGQADTVEYCIDVIVNSAPVAVCPVIDTILFCGSEIGDICIPGFEFFDVDGNIVNVEVSHGFLSGDTVCISPEFGGNVISIIVTDNCGLADTCRTVLNVRQNPAPQVELAMADTTIYLCRPASVCLPVLFADSNNNLANITVNRGNYSNGQVCFVPYDSGYYTIIATATDSCGEIAADTAVVRVLTDQYVNLQCPNDTNLFVCAHDTLCFQIGDIPEWAEVQVTGINTWFDGANQQVCFYVECGVSNRIVVKAITPCDTISCEFTVNVECNQPPVVFLPPDTTIIICKPDSVYIPVGISDANNNLSSINTPDWLFYEPISDRLIFYADTGGTYLISVFAYDSCGASSSDQITVRVNIDEAPVCDLPNDTTLYLCQPGQINLPIHSSNSGQLEPICRIIQGPGEIVNGQWVYQANSDGIVNVVVECVDACDNFCRDTFTVDIRLNEAPVCNIPNDTIVSQCVPAEICLPISSTDNDGNFKNCTIISGPGIISSPAIKRNIEKSALGALTTTSNLSWCYTPAKDTSFTVVMKCEDSCGAFCIDSFNVNIGLNDAPIVNCPSDTALTACSLSPISLIGFSSTDPNGDQLFISVSQGELVGNTVTFTPFEGENIIVFSATDNCGVLAVCTTIVNVNLNQPPLCILPNDTTITVCVSNEICLPVSATDVDGNFVGCHVISGPGRIENGYWCFTPDSKGSFTVTVQCTDACEAACVDSFTVNFDGGSRPTIENQFFSVKFCDEVFQRILQVQVGQAGSDPTKFELLSGSGSIDSLSGIITYLPDTPGVYSFLVEVSNSCGSDSATIYDTVKINRPPELVGFDSTVFLCQVQEICFDIFGFDPNGDSLDIQQIVGPGSFTQSGKNSGRSCFTPVKVDSAVTYLFVYQVTDLCRENIEDPYQYYYDTATITVILDKAPTLEFPPFNNLFACNSDSICFRIPAHDPEDFPYEVEILSGNAIIHGDSVACLLIDGAGDYEVIIRIIDSCGNSSTYERTFHVELNSPPQVILGDDFSINACTAQQVCVGLNISDVDANIESIRVNYGALASADSICFSADSSGVYSIIVTVTDSCGTTDEDTINVTVELNQPPLVQLGQDLSLNICSNQSICLTYHVSDENLLQTISNATLSGDSLCFVADTAGVYVVWLQATDSCGALSADTVRITITIPPPPFVDLGSDITTRICAPQEFCIDVTTINYPYSIVFNKPGYNHETGQFCFTASQTTVEYLKVIITDSCGQTATDSVLIDIKFNTAPEVAVAMRDSTIYLCRPQYICLPVSFADEQNNIANITVNRGSYSNGQVCFAPYDSGNYTIIATATDSCGAIKSDTAIIRIITDQYVQLDCPNDTTVFMCTHDTLCFPIGDIPSWATIQVTGINTWYNSQTQEVCFYLSCGVRNRITVKAITPCDTVSCSFTVDVRCNQPPLVLLPPDTTVTLCGPDSIRIPVGISDPNQNIASITTNSWARYEPITGKIGFVADTEGVYIVQVSVVDSCGAQDFEDISVRVRFNTPPAISFSPSDSVYDLCVAQEICLPIIFSDIDNNITQIIPSVGYYNSTTHEICFTPGDTFGLYCVSIRAIDVCGKADTATKCIYINNLGIVGVQCPNGPIYDTLCAPGTICQPIPISGDPDSVKVSYGNYIDGALCLNADSSGTYNIITTVYSPCTTLTCQTQFQVYISPSVGVTCPGNDTVAVCDPDTVFYKFSSTSVFSFTITPPAFIVADSIGVPVLSNGVINLTLIGNGFCGTDTCSFFVDARINSKPTVVSGRDTTLTDCVIGQYCVPFTVTDPDNNVTSVTGPDGVIIGNQYCFTPTGTGEYRIIIRATDACGAVGVDTTVVRVSQAVADIFCPSGTVNRTVCRGDSIRINVPITPFEANVTVQLDGVPNGFYNEDSALVIVFPQTPGAHQIRIIATAGCVTDTCLISLFVNFLERTTITCPAVIDTFVCPLDVDSICFPVTIVGANLLVAVSNGGRYQNGQVCVPINNEGTFYFTIIAGGSCGTDSCTTRINVDADDPPILHLPADTVVEMCDIDTNSICIDGIFMEGDSPASLNKICGPGTFQKVTNDSGVLCFKPSGNFYGDYYFCFEVNDDCNIRVDTIKVTVVESPGCDLCLVVSIDGGSCIPVGRIQEVDINIESFRPIGAFELLISFDGSVSAFSFAEIERTAVEGWEYFNYRFNSGACAPVCPTGLVRLVGLAETNDGANHPPIETLTPNGTLIHMFFMITNDQNVGGQFLPINFVTYECADNAFSDPTGNELYVDSKIYNFENVVIWDEDNNITYPEAIRPRGLGTPDSCIVGNGKGIPKRCVEFINGGICVIHPDSIDDRGDINLNGIPYEVADVVVYTNYFIYGLKVFTVNIFGQIAASDVNADGITLSVADLVLMLRIIIGDAPPIPKINPHDIELKLSNSFENGAMTITSETVNGIGGAYLVYQLDQSGSFGKPELSPSSSQMEMLFNIENNELRLLIFSRNGSSIDAGIQELVTIPFEGNQPKVTKLDFADPDGRPYTAALSNVNLPDGFALHQNYPNPFNPSTTLSFSLPERTIWELNVFNLSGARVKQFTGSNEPGIVEILWDGKTDDGDEIASGVYFYRLAAGEFKDTKKMIMLK